MINPSNLKISLYLSKKSSISAPNIPNNPLKKSGTAIIFFYVNNKDPDLIKSSIVLYFLAFK